MKKSISKILLIFVLAATVVSTVAISTMSVLKYNVNADTFSEDGYMLLASDDKNSDSINEQYYFNAGEKYRISLDNNVTFTDINGNKVSAEKENFIHYNSGSMNGLSESVVLNADNVENDQQVSYYSVPAETMMSKNGKNYTLNNAGNNINFQNFLWKISNDRYMVVSEKIDLIVTEESAQSFADYVELRYIDEGIAHLVTQEGTYSTISSDAYLLLSNGIRIYIGSKNVSNDESIIMNLTQMVVGSDDNIEVVPDEDYTIETDRTPKIVVNANDGETGADGEIGENGDNGEPGVKGSSGAKGDDGDDAANANVVYNALTAPLFTNIELNPNAFGFVIDNMDVDKNNCTISSSYISVIDLLTGQEVWRKNLGDETTLKSKYPDTENGVDPIQCDTLYSDSDYNFYIYATYKSKNDSTNASATTSICYQQLFHTDSFGMSLKKKFVTQDTLTLTLTKESVSNAKTVSVTLYDANMVKLDKFGLPLGTSKNNEDFANPDVYKSPDYKFNVSDKITPAVYDQDSGTLIKDQLDPYLAVGDSVDVQFTGLDSNTYYYVKLNICDFVEDDGSDSLIQTVPSRMSAQRYLTLKRNPLIETPAVETNQGAQMFIFNPGLINDYDNGIVSYRYEIFKLEKDGDNVKDITNEEADKATPFFVYNINSNQLNSINIPFGSVENNCLPASDTYRAQLVTVFNNNEETIEFRSNLTNKFGGGSEIDITIEFIPCENKNNLGSIVVGQIKITDAKGNLIKSGSYSADPLLYSKLDITYNAVDPGSDMTNTVNYLVDKNGVEIRNYDFSELTRHEDTNTGDIYYTMYAAMKSLKASTNGTNAQLQNYNIVLSASNYYSASKNSVISEKTVLGYDEYTSGSYIPLLVESYDVSSLTKYKTDYSFAYALAFKSSNYSIDNSLNVSNSDSDINAISIGNFNNLSIKSVGAIAFEVYEDNNGAIGNRIKKDGANSGTDEDYRFYIYDKNYAEANNLNSSSEPDSTVYKTGTYRSDGGIVLNSSNYSYKYDFNSIFYQNSYVDAFSFPTKEQFLNNEEFTNLVITNETFKTLNNGVEIFETAKEGEPQKIYYVKVLLFDYTFGADKQQINGKYNNEIIVGTSSEYSSNSQLDCYIEIKPNDSIPKMPSVENTEAGLAKVTYYEALNDTTKKIDNFNYKTNSQFDYNKYYKNASNLKNGLINGIQADNESIKTLWSSSGIDTSTNVGVVYSGPSSLASYCSDNAEIGSVKYLVYKYYYDENGDKKAKLVTTSISSVDSSEKNYGFMPYKYGKADAYGSYTYNDGTNDVEVNGKYLPKYTLYFDVEDNVTHEKISRGEEFYIETQIIVKGYEKNSAQEIETFPYDFDHDATKHDHDNQIYCDVVDSSYIDRQDPRMSSLLCIPYVSNAENTKDVIYLYVNDPDKTLLEYFKNSATAAKGKYDYVPSSSGELVVYYTEYGSEYEFGYTTLYSNQLLTVTAYDTDIKIPNSGLYIKCLLNNKLGSSGNLQYSEIPLVFSSMVNKEREITIVPIELTQQEWDDYTKIVNINQNNQIIRKIVNNSGAETTTYYVPFEVEMKDNGNKNILVRFQFKTNDNSSTDNLNFLLGAKLFITKYEFINNSDKRGVDKTNVSDFDYYDLIKSNQSETYTLYASAANVKYNNNKDGDDYIYDGEIIFSATNEDILQMIKGSGSDPITSAALKFDLDLYYDSGEYGTAYLDKTFNDNSYSNNLSSEYFAIQLSDRTYKTNTTTFLNNDTDVVPLQLFNRVSYNTSRELSDIKYYIEEKDPYDTSSTKDELVNVLHVVETKNSSEVLNNAFKLSRSGLSGSYIKRVSKAICASVSGVNASGSSVSNVVYSNSVFVDISTIVPDVDVNTSSNGFSSSLFDILIHNAKYTIDTTKPIYIDYQPITYYDDGAEKYTTKDPNFNDPTKYSTETIYSSSDTTKPNNAQTYTLSENDTNLNMLNVKVSNLDIVDPDGETLFAYRLRATLLGKDSPIALPMIVGNSNKTSEFGTFGISMYSHSKNDTLVANVNLNRTKDKKLTYTINTSKLIYDDFISNVDYVRVKVYNNSQITSYNSLSKCQDEHLTGCILSDDDAKTAYYATGTAIYDSNNIDSSDFLGSKNGEYVQARYSINIPWEASSLHNMKSTDSYWVEVEYIYHDATNVDKPQFIRYYADSSSNNKNYKYITNWTSFKNNTSLYFTVVEPTVNTDAAKKYIDGSPFEEGVNAEYRLKFTLEGKDIYRLLSDNSAKLDGGNVVNENKIILLAELTDADGNIQTYNFNNNTPNDTSDDKTYYQRQWVNVSLKANGNLNVSNIEFGHLEQNKAYKLNLYYVFDPENINNDNIYKLLQGYNLSTDQFLIKSHNELFGLYNNKIVTKGSGIYKLTSSQAYRTLSEASLYISAITLVPDVSGGVVNVYGNNLNKAGAISYTLTITDNTSAEPVETVESYTYSGTELENSYYRHEASFSGHYDLKVKFDTNNELYAMSRIDPSKYSYAIQLFVYYNYEDIEGGTAPVSKPVQTWPNQIE